jgi:predicted phosphodiesterase
MFDEPTWDLAMLVLKRDSCEFVLHPGDHLEGMSGRPGHVYELAQIGYEAQADRCIDLYSQIPKEIPIYGIDGNHDNWFKSKHDIGIVVGKQLENRLPNYHHLGEWEGTLPVSHVRIMLFHANDGTAYANSYKGQKLVESLDAVKPALIFSGHYHKSLYQYVRRIHMWESGTICRQTEWMRGKKIQAHVGFWRVEVEHNHGRVLGVESKWYCVPKPKS